MVGASPQAQLCERNIIAAIPEPDAVYCIAHEIGHAMVVCDRGEAEFKNEKLVFEEQIRFLVALSQSLLECACATKRKP
jgi:hypothetical protein